MIEDHGVGYIGVRSRVHELWPISTIKGTPGGLESLGVRLAAGARKIGSSADIRRHPPSEILKAGPLHAGETALLNYCTRARCPADECLMRFPMIHLTQCLPYSVRLFTPQPQMKL
jgi:hypothetical protein